MTPAQSRKGYAGVRFFMALLDGRILPEKQSHKQRVEWIQWFNDPKNHKAPKETPK